ncbi:60s ribosomal l36 [Fusarium beomiforme]|uniref:60s ribosomal l36 n=1 Tax=Fusarium beomiforme TaxID=44412 RepID=A0A9P5AN29_9HYPO|nr:60s ribosomal l36 [Fusarium beomiforme]
MALSQQDIEALLATPALKPPPGVMPQFDNPPNENALAWGVTTFLMTVATLCLFLRLYGRTWLERKMYLEEVLVIGAYGAYWGTAYAAYSLIWTPGYYVHTWDLKNGDLVKPLYCRPHNAIWEFYVPSKCYSLPKVMLTSASVQLASDVAMVLLPQRIIWNLNMKWQRKVGIAIIFGVGILACVAASFRLARTVTFAKEADTMYFIGPLLFWACGEMTCGFFILSVTTIPRIASESGLPSRLKRVLGISVQSTGLSESNSGSQPKPKPLRPSRTEKSSENYYKLDEDGIPMTVLGESESQERLNDGVHNKIIHVTEETHVTVESYEF